MRRIAIIDDDPLICDLLAYALGDTGADVACAMTGRSGRRLLTRTRFDLALIDVVLPGASGFALAELAANENSPPLLMTGHPNAAARAVQFGFPCLLKPFTLVQLRIESERVVATSRQNIQCIKNGMTRLRANFLGPEEARAESQQLIAMNRQLWTNRCSQSKRKLRATQRPLARSSVGL